MTLDELFDDLTYGELSQLNLGDAGTQGVTVDNRPHVVSLINRGLEVLHRRFLLKRGRLTVPLVEGQEEYPLASETLPFVRVEYVEWPEGFSSDVIPPRGQRPALPLNDEGAELSLFTPNHRTLWVPQAIWDYGARELTVVYRGGHKRIDKEESTTSPELIEVDLPEAFREPLLFYVASLVFNPLGFGVEGSHDGNNYAQKFEMACQQLETRGWDHGAMLERTSFHQRGFV